MNGMTPTEYVAVDIGKKKCVTCVMDQDGSVSETSSYPNTSFDANAFAKRVLEKYGKCKAVVESTGNMWIKTFEAFESNGIDIKLANPIKTRAIAEAKIKTDKVDSRTLAHLLRTDLIAECYVPSKDVRDTRSLLSHRINLAREVTRIRNRMHSLLDKYDLRCEYETITGVHGMNWLKSIKLGDYDQTILESLIREVEFLKKEEEEANSKIASYALQNKYVPIIMSMSGFDYYSASLLSAYIADIERFPSPSRLVSWAGMCPSVHQSGETLYHGKMKDGSKKVQWIMTQVANIAVQYDPRMKAYYEKLVKKHHHNIAMVHVDARHTLQRKKRASVQFKA